jgi:hypothetical protein
VTQGDARGTAQARLRIVGAALVVVLATGAGLLAYLWIHRWSVR